jgi:hypothetical protein
MSSDSNPNLPPNAVQSSDSMSSDSNPNLPPNAVQSSDSLDALPNASTPAAIDPQYGMTIPNDAVQSILFRSPSYRPPRSTRPPPRKHLPVESDTESEDESEHQPSPSPPPKSPSRKAALQRPTSSSNNQDKPPTSKTKPVKKTKPAAPKKPVVTKPSPAKVLKIIFKTNGTATRMQNNPRIPVRGRDFPDTGFLPTGTKLVKGKRKGHLSNEDCRGSTPNGCSLKDWKDKFRSVESVLMNQLDKDKERLDDMRDAGWVRDRALHMWDKEQRREAAKAAKEAAETRLAGEKDEAMEDVEEQDDEMKDVEEEGEEEENREEENQVYVPPQIEENMDDLYDA